MKGLVSFQQVLYCTASAAWRSGIRSTNCKTKTPCRRTGSMAGRPLLSQYKAFSATRSPFPRGQVCFQHRINNIGEKEEELSAFAYDGGVEAQWSLTNKHTLQVKRLVCRWTRLRNRRRRRVKTKLPTSLFYCFSYQKIILIKSELYFLFYLIC